jgi:phosphoenolpyruvate carboxykinase (ATP)
MLFFKGTNEVDFEDVSITPNTKSVTQYTILTTFKFHWKNPKNIFFLLQIHLEFYLNFKINTRPGCLPLHLWLYRKVAGTEAELRSHNLISLLVLAPFMPLHPTKYAEMLSKKIQSRCESLVNKYRMDWWSLRNR